MNQVRSDLLQRLAQSTVPSVADFCFIHLADKQHLRCAAAAHATRAGARLVRDIGRLVRIVRTDPLSTVAQVVRSGKPQIRAEIVRDPDPPPRASVFELYQQLAPQSALVVPLVADGRTLGALTLGYAESGRRYGPRDLPWAERLARQVTACLTRGAISTLARDKPLPRASVATTRRLPPLRARV